MGWEFTLSAGFHTALGKGDTTLIHHAPSSFRSNFSSLSTHTKTRDYCCLGDYLIIYRHGVILEVNVIERCPLYEAPEVPLLHLNYNQRTLKILRPIDPSNCQRGDPHWCKDLLRLILLTWMIAAEDCWFLSFLRASLSSLALSSSSSLPTLLPLELYIATGW